MDSNLLFSLYKIETFAFDFDFKPMLFEMVGIYFVVIRESYGFRITFVSASALEPGDRFTK